MSDFFIRFAESLWMLLLDTGVWLVAGLVLAGVVHVLIPREILSRHLSGGGVGPVVKASLLGIPLPLCSCSVIPVAAGLRASGASKGASAAFAISTPQTGEESIPLTWALFGPVYALARPVLAVATAFTAGMLIEVVGDGKARRHGGTEARSGEGEPRSHEATKPQCGDKACCGGGVVEEKAGSCCHEQQPVAQTPSSCCSTPEPVKSSCCCDSTLQTERSDSDSDSDSVAPWLRGSVASILRYGFKTMLRDLGPWLAIGLLLSALIAAIVPAGWIEANVGTGLVPMLLMLVVGMPLYVCATSTTPLAYTLVVAGLSPGAGLVLLLAGPATNAATMSWVLKDLGARSLVIYLVTIAVFAVAGGVLFDAFLAGAVRLAEHGGVHEHMAVTWVQTGGAVVFVVLLGWALASRYTPRRNAPAPGE